MRSVMEAVSVDADGLAVEGRRDSARQFGLEIGVQVVVREVCEIRALGADSACCVERFGNAQVRWMLRAEQRIDHEDAGALEETQGLSRQRLGIGDVGETADAIRKDRDMAMRHT